MFFKEPCIFWFHKNICQIFFSWHKRVVNVVYLLNISPSVRSRWPSKFFVQKKCYCSNYVESLSLKNTYYFLLEKLKTKRSLKSNWLFSITEKCYLTFEILYNKPHKNSSFNNITKLNKHVQVGINYIR